MLFPQSWHGNQSSCITTARDGKNVHMLCSLTTHGRTSKKLHRNGTVNFLTWNKEDGNHFSKRVIIGNENWIHFYELKRKPASMVWKKQRKKPQENSRMNGPPAGDVNGFLGLP